MSVFSQRSLDNLKGVHPNLNRVMHQAIKSTPVDFTITGGGRTAAQQQALYAQGRTKPGLIVTKADGVRNKSNHQAKSDGFYHAVDLYPFINGKVDINDSQNKLAVIAKHIKSVAKDLNIKISWGGDWKFKDKPHFELN